MMPQIIIAHRGASGHAPENTLLSYEKAWRIGAHMIELDVHSTADDQLVCIHDPTVDRTTNGTGEVSSLNIKEIQTLDAGLGQTIPLLEDVLNFARGRIQVNIELKILGIEERIVKLVNELEMSDEILVSSFLHISLSEILENSSRIRTAVLVQSDVEDLATYAHELGAYAINPAIDITTSSLIADAHELNLKVFPWTVNDETKMKRLLDFGVDGLITDFPDIGVHLIKSRFNL